MLWSRRRFAQWLTLWGLSLPVRAAAPQSALIDAYTLNQAGQRYRVIPLDLQQVQLKLFWQNAQGMRYGRLSRLKADLAAQGQSLLIGMNAGMYHANREPVGLYIERGLVRFALNTAQGAGNFFLQPNGVFAVNDQQQAAIYTTSAWATIQPHNIQYATQSGPMLLTDGVINPIFQPQSSSRKIRNGVGVLSPTRVVLIISETPVNFYEFAQVFAGLGCTQALYLDGTISSLYEAAHNRLIQRDELGVLIGVVQSSSTNKQASASPLP